MLSEVMEWEARGDGLRDERRFAEALEAYRTAMRQCVQWTREARACAAIREKIWAVQIEEFEAFVLSRQGAVPAGVDAETAMLARTELHPDTAELVAARLWMCGAQAEAERFIEAAVRAGLRGSGEFLDRLASRWQVKYHNEEGARWLRARACRMRGEQGSAMAAAAAAGPRAH